MGAGNFGRPLPHQQRELANFEDVSLILGHLDKAVAMTSFVLHSKCDMQDIYEMPNARKQVTTDIIGKSDIQFVRF